MDSTVKWLLSLNKCRLREGLISEVAVLAVPCTPHRLLWKVQSPDSVLRIIMLSTAGALWPVGCWVPTVL